MKYIDLQVVDVTGRTFKINKDNETIYKELIVKFGSTDITAYYTACINIEKGSLIRVRKWSLTNCWLDFSKCALLLSDISFIGFIDFNPVDEMPVRFTGTLVKSKNNIKVVGISQKKVFSSAVRFDNGRDKMFSILVVGFNEQAEELCSIPDGSRVVVSGNLVLAKITNDYEIHLTNIRKEREAYEGCNN